MASLSKIIWLLLPATIFFGQLFRFQILNLNFPAIDILIIILSFINIIDFIAKKKKIDNKYFLYFIIIALIVYLFNLFRFPFQYNSFLLLIRLLSLLSFFIFPPNIIKNITFQKIFFISIFTNIIFGLIQYIFWPDFTYFAVENWDPHLYRLISTYFDPTFTALIYLFFIGKVYFLPKKNKFKIPLLIISYIAFALTYSRASFVAFLIFFTYIAVIKKNIKIFLISLFLFAFTLFALPRQPGEGTKLERTSSIKAKIDNYQEAFTLYKHNPLIGIGYNNISQARSIQNPQSHANNSFDGSLINILITCGPIGLIIFLLALRQIFSKSDLLTQASLLSMLFHSLFANSLFYPFVLLTFIFFIQKNKK